MLALRYEIYYFVARFPASEDDINLLKVIFTQNTGMRSNRLLCFAFVCK